MISRHLGPKLTRYAMQLQEYDFEVQHRPGLQHSNVDAL